MNHIAELTEQVKALREKIGRQGQFVGEYPHRPFEYPDMLRRELLRNISDIEDQLKSEVIRDIQSLARAVDRADYKDAKKRGASLRNSCFGALQAIDEVNRELRQTTI